MISTLTSKKVKLQAFIVFFALVKINLPDTGWAKDRFWCLSQGPCSGCSKTTQTRNYFLTQESNWTQQDLWNCEIRVDWNKKRCRSREFLSLWYQRKWSSGRNLDDSAKSRRSLFWQTINLRTDMIMETLFNFYQKYRAKYIEIYLNILVMINSE